MQTRSLRMTLLIVVSAFCSWNQVEQKPIGVAAWLIGTWENRTSQGSFYETWTKVNDSELSGKSYAIKEKDTVVFETIRLIAKNDSLFYIPTVKNQNSNLPVQFKQKIITNHQLVFENLKHDFPQTIAYTRIGRDSLVAVVSGTKNGQVRKQTFRMIRRG